MSPATPHQHANKARPPRLPVSRTPKPAPADDPTVRGERLAAIGTLVAGLGHDLNNLLLPVAGHLAALQSRLTDDEALGHVKAIGQTITYLRQLNDNLRLCALDPNHHDDSCGVTHIGTWWAQLRGLLEFAVPQTAQFEVDLPADLPAVGVSAHRLTQAILNLLINAGEAVKEPGIIRLWAQQSDDHFVRVGVTDNGCGMSAHVRHHASDPFFTTKPRGRGTGMGLAIVQGIVRSVGGHIKIDSAPQRGTSVILELPVSTHGALSGAAETTTAPNAAVTVADPRIKACVEALLKSTGFTILEAADGNPGNVTLWITEPDPRDLPTARKWHARDPNCRIVLFGEGSAEWLVLANAVVQRGDSLSTIRAKLSKVLLPGK